MLELTKEECMELEKRVHEKLCRNLDDSGSASLYSTISKVAILATISTIREYERMKGGSSDPQQ